VTAAIAEALESGGRLCIPPLHEDRAKALEAVLTKPPLTTDQLIMIEEDNVCTMRDIRDAFGIEPIKFREGLRKFIAAK
jgi:hypothetical protein